MDTISLYFGDSVIFSLLQILILLLFAYAFVKDKGWLKKKGSIDAVVKRGEQSWSYFPIAFGILSVVIIEVIGITDTLGNYQAILIIINLLILLYLCFFSGWFRNKLVGFFSRSRQMEE